MVLMRRTPLCVIELRESFTRRSAGRSNLCYQQAAGSGREKTMFRKILVVAALTVAFSSAHAVEPKERGAYMGGGIGTSLFDDGGAFAGFSQDDSDTATMLFAGSKFFRYLAIEGRYSDFGSFDIGGVDIDATAISAHVVGTVPFGTSGWELYGQLGIGTLEFDVGFGGDDDQGAAAGGIGIRFSPTPTFSIGLQTDVFVWEDDSLGPTYDMGVGGTVLSARVIF